MNTNVLLLLEDDENKIFKVKNIIMGSLFYKQIAFAYYLHILNPL